MLFAIRAFGIEREAAPCHAAFHYVFEGLKVKALERALSAWVKRLRDAEVARHVCIATGDAIFCQRRICREVIERDGEYFFAVKENLLRGPF